MATLEKSPRRYTKKPAVRKPRLVRMPPALDEAVVTLAAQRGQSITDVVIAFIEQGLQDARHRSRAADN